METPHKRVFTTRIILRDVSKNSELRTTNTDDVMHEFSKLSESLKVPVGIHTLIQSYDLTRCCEFGLRLNNSGVTDSTSFRLHQKEPA